MLNSNISDNEGKFIGVDIGGTSCKFGLFSQNGDLLKKWSIKTFLSKNGSQIINKVVESIKDNFDGSLLGIGLTVPGVCRNGGEDVTSVNLRWKKINVKKELANLVSCPIAICNDANAAAVGELFARKGNDYHSLVILTLGTGIGGGAVINGKILDGPQGTGGEFGHMIVNTKETRSCTCGRCGCLEQYASASGLVRFAKEKVTGFEDLGEITPQLIFNQARVGNKTALEVLNEFGEYLGLAMANIAMILNPEVFVIGGGLSGEGQYIIDLIDFYFKKYAFDEIKNTPIELSKLGNDAGIYGAFNLVSNN